MMAGLPDFQEQAVAHILLLVHADGLMTLTGSEDLLRRSSHPCCRLDEDEIERDRELTVKPRLTWRWKASKAKTGGQRKEGNNKKPHFLPLLRASRQLLDSLDADESALRDRYFELAIRQMQTRGRAQT